MKTVTMYEADDGTMFKTIKKALSHNVLNKKIKSLLKLLGGQIKDSDCGFANGGGYYQLSSVKVAEFDEQFLVLVRQQEPWIFKNYIDVPEFNKGKPYTNDQLINSYIIGRCLDDSNSPLYGALYTRLCVDSSFKRWGQRYFALNPDKGLNKKLGDFL